MKGTGFKLLYLILATLVAVLYLSNSTLRNIFNLKEEAKISEHKLASLKQTNSDLSREIKWYENTKDHVKYTSRRKLGYIESGEKKIYLLNEKSENIEK